MFAYWWDVHQWQGCWSITGLPIQCRRGEEAPILSSPLLLIFNWSDPCQRTGIVQWTTSQCGMGEELAGQERTKQPGF